MRKKGVTISDIAERTGYSKTTVSFAFNWPNRISADAVAKILQCAKDIGYKANVGQVDSENRFKTICVILSDSCLVDTGFVPAWARPAFCIYKLCAEKGFMLSLIDAKRMSDIHFARTCVVDAFMVFSPTEIDPFFLDTIRKRKIPFICINNEPECDTEDEKKMKRIENAEYCANLMFDILSNKTIVDVDQLGDAVKFFEPNL